MNKNYEYRDNLGNPRDYYDIVNDANMLCEEIEEKDKEIERLNKECDTYMKIATKRGNIINELERWMKDSEIEVIGDSETFSLTYNDALNKLKSLKEGK